LRRFKEFVAVSLSLAGSACGEAKAKHTGFDPFFDHETPAGMSFSFEYVSAPPEGRHWRANGVAGVDDTCSLFEGALRPANFEATNIILSGAEHATYEIDAAGDLSKPARANVQWVRVVDGDVVARALAATGSVEYRSGPQSEAEWPAVRTATLKVHAGFESDPIVRSECNGGMDVNTGERTGSCNCERLSGTAFTCDSTADSCCHDVIGEVELHEFTVEANACAAQCAFTDPELVTFCRALE
jgi:hypothetical protein